MSRILVALLALALALPVAAQAPAKRPEEPRDLAAAYLSKRGADGRFDRSMAAYRTTAVRMLVDMGAPEPLAGEIWDAEVTPGYEAKRLDMVARDQDVVLRHLTGAEMQAVLAGGASEASRSAAAKSPALQRELGDVTRSWGIALIQDVTLKGEQRLKTMGLLKSGAAR